MKKLIIILFLIPVFCRAQIHQDKIYHTTAGIVITEACYIPYYSKKWDFGTSTRVSFAAISMVSMGKEMVDAYSGGRFSFEDIGYDMIGWGITVGCNYIIHRIKVKKLKKKKIIEL